MNKRKFNSTNPNVNLGLSSSKLSFNNLGEWIYDKAIKSIFKLDDSSLPAIEQDARVKKYSENRYRLATKTEIDEK